MGPVVSDKAGSQAHWFRHLVLLLYSLTSLHSFFFSDNEDIWQKPVAAGSGSLKSDGSTRLGFQFQWGRRSNTLNDHGFRI
jgi:hypothetical protein